MRISEERPTCQLELRTSHLQGNGQSLQQAVIGGERGSQEVAYNVDSVDVILLQFPSIDFASFHIGYSINL